MAKKIKEEKKEIEKTIVKEAAIPEKKEINKEIIKTTPISEEKNIKIEDLDIENLVCYTNACKALVSFYAHEFKLSELKETEDDRKRNAEAIEKSMKYDSKYYKLIKEVEKRIDKLCIS